MFVSDNKVSTIVSYFKTELVKIYDEREALSMINILFQHIFEWDKIQLRMNGDHQLSESERLNLKSILNRLREHEPIQYILGETEFYGLDFKVDSNVLIPRQETEELVDLIIKENKGKTLKILDIGTGSGCIPISLKKHLPNTTISAIDISNGAIEVAKQNAILNGVEVEFSTCDVFSEKVFDLGDFDIVVSNPPYIGRSEEKEMTSNVLDFEPKNALFVDEDIMEFYDRIIQISNKVLNTNGTLYFELNEHYKSPYSKLFEAYNMKYGFHNDLNGKLRMAKLSK